MEMHREQFGEFVCGYWGLKGYAVFFILFCGENPSKSSFIAFLYSGTGLKGDYREDKLINQLKTYREVIHNLTK